MIILSIAIIASSLPFVFYPTHKIVKEVNCISCHAEEFRDVKLGIHIRPMYITQKKVLYDYLSLYGNKSESAYRSLVGPCYSCHVTYGNYKRFGLTDPYIYQAGNYAYTIGNIAVSEPLVNAQYGTIVEWPQSSGNRAIEYFGASNVAITAELEVLNVTPSNASINSDLKIILSNYSGQQNGSVVCDCAQTLSLGDKQVITVGNIKDDYFNMVAIFDGTWSNAAVRLNIIGTDQGIQSFIINANSPSVVYSIPKDLTGTTYLKTNGSYRAVRLDVVWEVWKNYSVNGNIASSETILTNSTSGWVESNTCSSPDAMCHINQKTTQMGLADGMGKIGSLYNHEMESVTSKQCRICHLRYRNIGEIPVVGGPTTTLTSVPTSIPTSVPTNIPTSVPTGTATPTSTGTPTSLPTGTPTSVPTSIPASMVKVAGFRSSDYGGPLNGNNNGHDQTDPAYWVSVAQRMQAKFPGSSPGAQYVVGYIETPETNTYMPFPAPAGYEGMANVDFGPTGVEEQMLTAFDAAGMKVILQVEPGNANVPMLATMILNKFKGHSSVVGFGVDVEWLRWVGSNSMGSQTNDAEIQTWLDAVHAINPNYKLLIKHWDPTWLGSGHVAGVTYVTDSLNHGSYSAAITDYVSWANHFSGSEIGYQIGYEEDMVWWLPMADPAPTIIADIKTQVPTANIYNVYWVDFAVTKEFPVI
jgi:hypothetical protein